MLASFFTYLSPHLVKLQSNFVFQFPIKHLRNQIFVRMKAKVETPFFSVKKCLLSGHFDVNFFLKRLGMPPKIFSIYLVFLKSVFFKKDPSNMSDFLTSNTSKYIGLNVSFMWLNKYQWWVTFENYLTILCKLNLF